MRINDSFQRFAALVAILSLFLDSLGNMLNVEFLTLLGLSIYILLAPIWALWIGIDLLRKPVQVQPL